MHPQRGSLIMPSELSQAERAARALAEEKERKEQEVPLELQLLATALDFRSAIRTVIAAVVPRFADWCFLDLIDGDGIPRRIEVAHAEPRWADLAREVRAVAPGPGWATPAAQAIRDRSPRLLREITETVLQWATHDEKHLEVLKRIGPNSMLAVPLVARDRTIGALTFIRSTSEPGFDEEDLVFASDIAAPAALALDNARWHAGEKAARHAAEQDADIERHARIEAQEQVLRLRRLESVTSSLGAVLPPEGIARVAHDNGLSLLETSSATIVQAAGDRLEILYAYGWPDDLLMKWRTLPVEAPALVAEAYRIQTAIWIDSPEALAQAYPNAAELPRLIGDQAWAAVPLRVDGRVIGAMGMGFLKPRTLSDGERRFVLAIAQLVAQALERARLRELALSVVHSALGHQH